MRDAAITSGAEEAERLLRACAAGDHAAFRRLYDLWGARLHGVALRITRQAALAADATQEAFVEVWRNAHRFDPSRGSAETWLVSLARYRALDIVRRRGREVPGYEPDEREDEAPGPLDRLLGESDAAALRRCLERLPEERRRLLLLAFVDGLSHSELAARVQAPLGTLKSWIRRSLLALRECLGT